jgi:hypothetical protein
MRYLYALLALAACTPSGPEEPTGPPPAPRPALATAADSLAWRIVQASGGLDAWQALPRLRFDFASVRDTAETFRARHLWERTTGRYRIEYPVGEDSTLVALFDAAQFDPDAPSGTAYLNGALLDSIAARERLREAYEQFVNDTYWLLAPLKLFDPGVRRTLAPDSARAGVDVLHLSFENVGLTPGDRYWLSADRTGRLVHWSYVLESGRPGSYVWGDVVSLPTPRGPLRLATRKHAGPRAILTPVFPAEDLPADVFERPTPVL